jgi:hypothetical protein
MALAMGYGILFATLLTLVLLPSLLLIQNDLAKLLTNIMNRHPSNVENKG